MAIDVAKSLKDARLFRKLSIRQLAKRTGLATSTIVNTEKGNKSLTLRTFYKIVHALDYEVRFEVIPQRDSSS